MRGSPAEEGRRWLEQAQEDLRWAEELVLGHSVERLCGEAARYDSGLHDKARRGSILDGFYITTRYPNSLPESIPARVYTEDVAREAVRLAGEIVAEVGRRLKSK